MTRLAFAVAVVVAVVMTTSQTSAATIPQIIAGVQVGPVRLRMRADDGARAALAFEQATGCHIDLLIAKGQVSAAGTDFGGCLEVFVPQNIRRVVSRVGFFQQPEGPFVGGPASAFVAAFGAHLELRLGARQTALVWPQGMVAYVVANNGGKGTVTYLAVVVPGSKQVPAIGYFK